MSLFATLSAVVLTGAATPVSIVRYQTGWPTREWTTPDPPVPAVLVGQRGDVDVGSAAVQYRAILYVQSEPPIAWTTARVTLDQDGAQRTYDVISQHVMDGVTALELSALMEDGI